LSITRTYYKVSKNHLILYVLTIPFQIMGLIAVLLNFSNNVGFSISFLVTFIFFPFLFYLVFSEYIDKIDLKLLIKYLKNGIFFVSIFGVIQFFFRIFTGKFIQIPLLTLNLHDFGSLETTKCILRGNISKLISTYNNGNIYGICMLMFFPLISIVEKRKINKIIFKISLILTLSRTVWIGMIFAELVTLCFLSNKNIFKKIIPIVYVILIIGIIIKVQNWNLSFIFDSTLGGRSGLFEGLKNITFFPKSFHKTDSVYYINEIVYISILNNIGLFGFIFFIMGFFAPMILFFKNYYRKNTLRVAILLGLVVYYFCCLSDGAMLFIPTMIFYWFLSSLMFASDLTESEMELTY